LAVERKATGAELGRFSGVCLSGEQTKRLAIRIENDNDGEINYLIKKKNLQATTMSEICKLRRKKYS
jgi:hypothetical protein